MSFLRNLLLAALLPASAAWAQADLQEGLWEVSITMAVGGQPTSGQPLVMRQCISQQSAQELISQLNGAGTGSCNTADLQQDGGRASWKVSCSGPVELDGSGSATFMPDRFDGAMNGQIGMGNQKLAFSQSFSARRIGACQ
jgi:hypothetical protein